MLLVFCEIQLNDAHRWRNGGPRVVWGLPKAAAALPSLNRGGDEKLGWPASELFYCSIISYCSPTHDSQTILHLYTWSLVGIIHY